MNNFQNISKNDKKELKEWQKSQDQTRINWQKKKNTAENVKPTKKSSKIKEIIPNLPLFDLKLFDKDYLRLSTKNKKPLIKGWSNSRSFYQEKKTIMQLLKENGEYGLRTGKILFQDYYFCVVIFQKASKIIDSQLNPFLEISYVETEKTCHYYLLIRELPINCSLRKSRTSKLLGYIFSNGKQVAGPGSKVANFTYHLIKKKQDFYLCETVKDLEGCLKEKDIFLNKDKEKIRKKSKNSSPISSLSISAKSEENLNEEQKKVKELVLAGKGAFLTGSAGTGKSFLLQQLITILQAKYSAQRVGVTSTTGTGAIIIGGVTLHSYLGIGLGENLTHLLTSISNSRKAQANWKRVRVLIIDEVSMLPGELFEKLEIIARKIRDNDKPFGGIQLVLVGDFCQLPPAGKTFSKYCFEVDAWSRCINETVNLKQVYRQKSSWFINYLQDIRFGRLSKLKWENMLNWLGREPQWPDDGIKPVSLFSTNQEVGNINNQELAKLSDNSYFFLAKDEEREEGELKKWVKNCPAAEKLELKVGAQVIFIKNWWEKKLVNGSQGVVVGFTNDSSPLPIVKFINGKQLTIEAWKWEKIGGYNTKNRPIILATRTQIPLILAWAITVNKSQGQSLERVKIDLAKCFMGGQVYTALSRATNPQYLQIINFSYTRLWCDSKVRNFYCSLDGKITKLTTKRKVNSSKEYLENKVRNKWKEFVIFYENSQEWPHEDIKKLLEQQNEDYYRTFCRVIEKSISNSQKLTVYRELINYLQEWWKSRKIINNLT